MTLLSRASVLLAATFTLTTTSPAVAAWDAPPHRATVFLNFDGGTLAPGENSSLMQEGCLDGPLEYPAFDRGDAVRQEIVAQFEAMLAPYGIRVTTSPPPPELPHTLVMLGGTPDVFGQGESVVSHSCSNDCGDLWSRDTIAVFTANPEAGTNTLYNAALLAFGFSVGLNSVLGDEDVMRGYAGGGVVHWSVDCVPLLDEPAKCGYIHEEFCPPGQQNDHAELLALFGENTPDTVAPVVEILQPVDGTELAGTDLEIEAEVSDDHAGFGWKLVLRRDDVVLAEAPAYAGETSWQLNNLEPGAYQVEVAAIDHDRNVGRDVVTVYVGSPAPGPGSTSGDEPGSSSGDDSDTPTSGQTEGSDSEGIPATTGEEATSEGLDDEAPQGCACTAASEPRGGALLILVGLAGLVRRRARPGAASGAAARSSRPGAASRFNRG
jgi:MYXO-CTERM domain-containing protein